MSKDDSKTAGSGDHVSERQKPQLQADDCAVAVRLVLGVGVGIPAGWVNKGDYAYDWRHPLQWATLGRTRGRVDRYKRG